MFISLSLHNFFQTVVTPEAAGSEHESPIAAGSESKDPTDKASNTPVTNKERVKVVKAISSKASKEKIVTSTKESLSSRKSKDSSRKVSLKLSGSKKSRTSTPGSTKLSNTRSRPQAGVDKIRRISDPTSFFKEKKISRSKSEKYGKVDDTPMEEALAGAMSDKYYQYEQGIGQGWVSKWKKKSEKDEHS